MASASRVEFLALATAVVETALALLSSERPASRQADVLSVEAAWARVDCTPNAGQTRAAPILAVVKGLLIAHDENPGPVYWQNPGGRVGRTKPGEKATQRQSRPRNRGGGGKNGGGDDHHHRRGGDSGGGGGGGASGAGVAEGAAEGATLIQQSGQLTADLAEAT